MAGWMAAPNAGRIPASAFYKFNGDIYTVSASAFFKPPYFGEVVKDTTRFSETFVFTSKFGLTLNQAFSAADSALDVSIAAIQVLIDGLNLNESVISRLRVLRSSSESLSFESILRQSHLGYLIDAFYLDQANFEQTQYTTTISDNNRLVDTLVYTRAVPRSTADAFVAGEETSYKYVAKLNVNETTGIDTAIQLQTLFANATINELITAITLARLGQGLETSDAFTTSEFVNYSRICSRSATDFTQLAETYGVQWSGSTTLEDYLGVLGKLNQVEHLSLVDLANIIVSNETLFLKTIQIFEKLKTLDNLLSRGYYGVEYSDISRVTDKIITGFPIAVLQELTTTEIIHLACGLHVFEKLNLDASFSNNVLFNFSFADRARFVDSLLRFVSGDISDSFNLVEVTTPKFFFTRSVTDTASVTDASTSTLLLRVTANDDVHIESIDALKYIFKPTLIENLRIAAAYVSPNDTFTTWAVNTETGAVTEYTNYNFNSFAELNGLYFAASESGLYDLLGDDDAGTDIIANLKSGYAQFGGSKLASLKGVYLGLRGEGNWVLKIITADGKESIYSVVGQNMQTTKVRLGKGLRARYFAYELVSTGQDFDLESIEFVPLIAQRRV